jgi:cholesterol transport system auxiliary component
MNPSRLAAARRTAPLLALGLAALAGCSSLLLGGESAPVTTYGPSPHATLPDTAPAVTWQLEVAPPQAIGLEDGLRVLVEPVPGQLEVYAGARWAARPSDQLAATLLHALQGAGRITGVGLSGSGLLADYRVLGEVRRYRAEYAGQSLPAAHLEVSLQLLRVRDQHVVASHRFDYREPANDTSVAAVNAAFERALAQYGRDAGLWVLRRGQADWSSAAH